MLSASAKEQRYAALATEIAAVTAGEGNLTSRMATTACLLHFGFDAFLWTGFYLVDPDKENELVVGPYQGTMGCLRIPFGQGVCGAAAEARKTVIVADVESFPGHIACDTASKSEIVVPVFDAEKNLIAVLDVDSAVVSAFDEIDAKWLEEIVGEIFSV
ncbi:MAG: GAF domain-containing protein [Proteobacteria bacterium]|nr:GAF domain-containing protein [Pseudomonadota bacterium]